VVDLESFLAGMKSSNSKLLSMVVAIGVLLAVSLASAQESALPAALTSKPAASFGIPSWISELSVGILESYDNNALGVSGDGPMGKQWSWVTSVSPKIGFNLLPAFGDRKVIKTFTIRYSPDFIRYHDLTSESYSAHRITTTTKGKSDQLSFGLENGFLYVDGSRVAPTYLGNDAGRSTYAMSLPRERRAQFQDRAKVTLQYDLTRVFVRPVGSLLYYDLLTDQRLAAGYQNFVDRYDANGGVDFGFRPAPEVALTLGYRYGHQYHQQVVGSIYSSSNDYSRVLVGMEGKPFKWLTVALSGGPDFRSYEQAAPVSDRHPVKPYCEASMKADFTRGDSVVFKYLGWQWVSSTGRIPFFQEAYELSWNHKFEEHLTTDLGAKLVISDYTSGNIPASLRNDRLYCFSAGVTYSISANLGVKGDFSSSMGRNHQDELPAGQDARFREFDRFLTTIGLMMKF